MSNRIEFKIRLFYIIKNLKKKKSEISKFNRLPTQKIKRIRYSESTSEIEN